METRSIDDRPTTGNITAVVERSTSSQEAHLALLPTSALIERQVATYFQAKRRLPAIVAMHPLRLLTIPSATWPSYTIPGLGEVALHAVSFVECRQNVDAMFCGG